MMRIPGFLKWEPFPVANLGRLQMMPQNSCATGAKALRQNQIQNDSNEERVIPAISLKR
jgi:hypothetical protein